MNKCLIHNNNIGYEDYFDGLDGHIKFTLGSNNIDGYISQKIISKIKNKKYNVIFIKDNLSSNYLELYGLRVAYHIRLSEGVNQYTPIVILSDIDSHTLNKLDPMARILFTKNVFTIKNSRKAIEEFEQSKKISELTKDNYKDSFLNLIRIEPPENSTSHSITNEWAIERWANLLDIKDNKTINRNLEKISSMLYIKYLKQKYILNTNIISINKNENITGKLLFIDDRGSDGWNDIIKTYIDKHSNIEFKALESIYDNINNIEESIKKEVLQYDPNIILLDLRLLKNESKTIGNISGNKILEHIKKLNPSIQVIMFTASNDSDILDTLYTKGILGFVKKDAPTDKYISSKNGFKKLFSLIKKANCKIYLQEIYSTQEEIIKLDLFKSEEEKIKELKIAVITVFDVLNSNMPNNLTFAMFSIFKCIEIVTYLYIKEENKKAFWRDKDNVLIQNTGYFLERKDNKTADLKHIENENKKSHGGIGNSSVENKIRTILHQKLYITSNELHSQIKCIVCIRNHAIHQDKEYEDKDFCKIVVKRVLDEKQLVIWFAMLNEIIDGVSKYPPEFNVNRTSK